jgi:hypothetical protein
MASWLARGWTRTRNEIESALTVMSICYRSRGLFLARARKARAVIADVANQ